MENESISVRSIEVHRQIWKVQSSWTHYWSKPRYVSGFLFICPGVTAHIKDINGNSFTAQSGDIIYAPRECRYTISFENGGNDPDAYTINFDIFDKDKNELRFADSVRVYRGILDDSLFLVAERLSRDYIFSKPQLYLQAGLFDLFLLLIKALDYKKSAGKSINYSIALLSDEWNKNEPVSKYAKECKISESGFHKAFKEKTGQTPVEFRNSLRISAAKSMLHDTDLSISEIAYATGFDDPYYFSRVFTKIEGKSPRAYRNAHRNMK
ncbi:MAG: helix-turn-helix transcriptional regulator [Clostridia bacterium]|nr:helix-turn-helix transcriptional regulator [Clostridia bacterium]